MAQQMADEFIRDNAEEVNSFSARNDKWIKECILQCSRRAAQDIQRYLNEKEEDKKTIAELKAENDILRTKLGQAENDILRKQLVSLESKHQEMESNTHSIEKKY